MKPCDRRSADERQEAARSALRETRAPRLLALAEASGDDELIRDVVAAYVVAATKRHARSPHDEALVTAAGTDVRTLWRWSWLAGGEAMLDLMAEHMLAPPPTDLDVRRRRLARLWATGSPEPPPDPLPARVFDAREILVRARRSERGRQQASAC